MSLPKYTKGLIAIGILTVLAAAGLISVLIMERSSDLEQSIASEPTSVRHPHRSSPLNSSEPSVHGSTAGMATTAIPQIPPGTSAGNASLVSNPTAPGSASSDEGQAQTTKPDQAKEQVGVSGTLTIGGKKAELGLPNELGVFPARLMKPLDKMVIHLTFPSASPGDLVVAAIQDGGRFDNGQSVLPLHVDKSGGVNFNYQVSAEPGLFRVTLRKGTEVKTVQFWAGPELKLAGEE